MSLVPTRPVPPDDLDGLLRAFYRKEMPSRWPAPPVPPAPTLPYRRPNPSNRALFRSRLALAASVALLLLGSLFVGGKVGPIRTDGEPGVALPDGSATREKLPPKKGAIKTSLSLEQDPAGETQIKVDAMLEDVPPSR
jgi:hypothetical protein